ncbi:MAG: hypothetical protein K0S46_1212 [Moraxellaceae bacterium]|jgi:hypothetical protein|nr:hypothetical protein [Moraxellaceae bacterium]
MKRIIHGLVAATALAALAGCSGNPSAVVAAQASNRDMEKSFSPLRLVATSVDKRASQLTFEFAGTPAPSITANAGQLRGDIFRSLSSHCGFTESDLVETRVVRHRIPTFYEVWVFNDPQSERPDKRSGLSVVMKQLPNNGGVDFQVHGSCHTKGATFVMTR